MLQYKMNCLTIYEKQSLKVSKLRSAGRYHVVKWSIHCLKAYATKKRESHEKQVWSICNSECPERCMNSGHPMVLPLLVYKCAKKKLGANFWNVGVCTPRMRPENSCLDTLWEIILQTMYFP